ncbi:MAG: hypothetical protein ACR2FY_08755 [Pirellulaceae bacterium]
MTTQELEQRLSKLENEVSTLRAELQGTKPSWQRAVESLTGDEGLQEIFAESMKLREKDRQKARKRRTASRKPKK